MCGSHHCLGRGAFASGPEILRRLLQLRQNTSILEQGCAGHPPNSANRKHQITRRPWRTSPQLRPSLSFRYTQGMAKSFDANAGGFKLRTAVEFDRLPPGESIICRIRAGPHDPRNDLHLISVVAAFEVCTSEGSALT